MRIIAEHDIISAKFSNREVGITEAQFETRFDLSGTHKQRRTEEYGFLRAWNWKWFPMTTTEKYVWENSFAETIITNFTAKGAFLWDDPEQDQWSKITQIMAHQRNREILAQSGFLGSFDAPWSEWSWITDPDLDHPKETHPKNLLKCQML